MTSPDRPTLHVLAGRICAGKSTLADRLVRSPATVVVREDEWLGTLFGDDMKSVADFVRCSARLRAAMTPHLVDLLQSGLSVVLDFQANTVAARQWMRDVAGTAGSACRLHFLDVSEDECRARLRRRNAEGRHPFTVTDEQFDAISAHFVAPGSEEGFEIVVYGEDDNGAGPLPGG